jgi:hypothetical protein
MDTKKLDIAGWRLGRSRFTVDMGCSLCMYDGNNEVICMIAQMNFTIRLWRAFF